MDDSSSGTSSRAQAYWRAADAQESEAAQARAGHSHSRRMPLGMDSFDQQAQHEFGQRVRLAMGLMEGALDPPVCVSGQRALPTEPDTIAKRLRTLGREVASTMADQLELLVRFDEQQGWQASGSRHCVAWIDLELGISRKLGWEYLRAGRRLRDLPITRSQFRSGSLGWSKVRLISRVATPETEALLCHAALDASVSELERLCKEYRWQEEQADAEGGEKARALSQFRARSFSWDTASNGNTNIRISLPPEVARAFLNSVEHSLGQLEESGGTLEGSAEQVTMRQRRADAAVLMAETSLQSAGRDIATSDRYQVIVTVDATECGHGSAPESAQQADQNPHQNPHRNPGKRPTVAGAGPIARETARRLACDCSVSTLTLGGGEPIDIGRKSRLWPPAMARAIKTRDQHCQYPGCSISRHLQIHHLQHWADGGSTCVDNGVCLCTRHHTLVHEGGYRIERVDGQAQRLNEQFTRQQATDHPRHDTCNDIERLLRNSRESFDCVRSVSPTRFRFRVVDGRGRDIRDSHALRSTEPEQSTCVDRPAKDTAWPMGRPAVGEPAGAYRVTSGRP